MQLMSAQLIRSHDSVRYPSVSSFRRVRALLLILAMLVMSWHVASHGLELSVDVGDQEECQVCRLSHSSAAGFSEQLNVVPALFSLETLLVSSSFQILVFHSSSHQARAPPAVPI